MDWLFLNDARTFKLAIALCGTWKKEKKQNKTKNKKKTNQEPKPIAITFQFFAHL